jgi:hypothetical protein
MSHLVLDDPIKKEEEENPKGSQYSYNSNGEESNENTTASSDGKHKTLLPKKPSNDDNFDDDVYDPTSNSDHDTITVRELSDGKFRIASGVCFVIASAIYVALEVTVLPYYQFYRDVPYDIRENENGKCLGTLFCFSICHPRQPCSYFSSCTMCRSMYDSQRLYGGIITTLRMHSLYVLRFMVKCGNVNFVIRSP